MSLNRTVEKLLGKLMNNTLVPGLTLTTQVTWVEHTPDEYDPTTGRVTRNKREKAIEVISKDSLLADKDRKPGYKAEIQFYVKREDFLSRRKEDLLKDTVKIEGVEYQVVDLAPITLGTTNLLYQLTVK